LRALRAFDRRAVLDIIERVLATTPTRVGQSRIKRLRGVDSPQYRLRVGEFRVFYDVDVAGPEVYVLRVLTKAAVAEYLREVGHEAEDGERGTTGPGDGESGE
jgi:mRNA interferase RelE/StbE